MMKRIKGWLFCLGLRKNSGFLSWKGSSLIAVRQKGFSLSAASAAGAALMAPAWASPERSLRCGAPRELPAAGLKGHSAWDWETAPGSCPRAILCGKGWGQLSWAALSRSSPATPGWSVVCRQLCPLLDPLRRWQLRKRMCCCAQ